MSNFEIESSKSVGNKLPPCTVVLYVCLTQQRGLEGEQKHRDAPGEPAEREADGNCRSHLNALLLGLKIAQGCQNVLLFNKHSKL